MRKASFVLLLICTGALVATSVAQVPIPIVRARIGNNTEGATLITGFPFAEQVALLDGYDVIAMPVEGRGRTVPQKLFDVKALHPIGNPSGIVYVPSERAFLFNDNGQPDTLLATDEQGRPLPPRPITYLPEVPFVFEAEGMTYLPPGSPFPDRIARIAFVPPAFAPDIEIITRAGVVEREIPLPAPLNSGSVYTPGLAYDHFSRSFIVSAVPVFANSAGPGEFWKIGFDGAAISGPIVVPGGAVSLEGLAELPNGRIVAADYAAGKLFTFNADLTPDPSGVRSFQIGSGVSRPGLGVSDPRTRRYAFSGVVGPGVFFQEGVAEISRSLDSASRLFGFDGTFEPHRGLAYVPEDDAFALGRFFGPSGIDIFRRDGSLLDQIDFTTVAGLPQGTVQCLAYVASTRRFAITMFEFPNQIFLVSRARAYDGSFAITGAPTSLQYVSQSGQDRLLLWEPPALLTYDLGGVLLATKKLPIGGLVSPIGFIAGPGDGFAIYDPNNSEVVVFSER